MQHLPIERLAELGDVEPTRDEMDHLAECAQCARERAAYRRLAGLAGDERLRIGVPLTEWSGLRSRLQREGLIRSRWWSRSSLGMTRLAATLLLMAGGVLVGRLSAGLSYAQALALRGAPAQSADSAFESSAAALGAMTVAAERYQAAATYLAANDTLDGAEAYERYRTRLAFLDQLAQTTREALEEVPHDPVMNQYYVSTLGARDATLHRIGQIVPVSNRLGRF
ncbi:MAG: hypothetical protein ACT4R6_13070 [Gemmatimonadaceae bacterium]